MSESEPTTEALRIAFTWHVLHQLVAADQIVSRSELQAIQRIYSDPVLAAYGFIDARGARTEHFRVLSGDALVELPTRLKKAEKFEILDQLFAVALADDDYHREEDRILAHAARLLGIGHDEFEGWLGAKPNVGNIDL